MGLILRNNALLIHNGVLATDCCCDRYWCVQSEPAGGPCEPTERECQKSSVPPPNAVGGPYRSEEECAAGCQDEPKCCEDDSDCPEGYVCEDGICVPRRDPPPPPPEETEYNCCRDPSLDPDQPAGRPRCVQGPCLDANGIPAPGLRAGGPYRTPQQCADSCRSHDCAISPCCDTPDCTPSQGGPHETLEACREQCAPERAPCVVAPNGKFSGAGGAELAFSVNCEKNPKICVRYVSKSCGAFRIQIVADDLDSDGNCTVIAEDVVKVDSGWKGKEECPCPELDSFPGASPDGRCSGVLRWNTKEAGLSSFRVRIFAPCAQDGRNSWAFTIQCTNGPRGACDDPCEGEPEPCPEGCCGGECDEENPCEGEDCHCCDGVCQDEPCEPCDCTDCVWDIDNGTELEFCETPGGGFGVDGNFSTSFFSGPPTWGANPVWKPGYPDALEGKCYRFVLDTAGCPQECDSSYLWYAWYRIRLFVYDCESQSAVDITSDAIEPRACQTCDGYVLRDDLCGDPNFELDSPLPFNDAVPTVTCNPLP